MKMYIDINVNLQLMQLQFANTAVMSSCAVDHLCVAPPRYRSRSVQGHVAMPLTPRLSRLYPNMMSGWPPGVD